MNTNTTNNYDPEVADVLAYNRRFVAERGYEPYATTKYPDKKIAVIACMDTRLTTLLPAALGLQNGDAKIIKNAGGLVTFPYDSAMRSLLVGIYELGVESVMVIAHSDCGACHLDGHHMHQLMLERGISEQTIETVNRCGVMPVEEWLEGFHDTEQTVRKTVDTIRHHPLVPGDVRVYGFIIDSYTGALTEVACP